MNKDIVIKDIQAEYIFHTNDEENKNKILEEAVANNKEACYVTYGTNSINSTYQPSPIKDDDYYMKYCNSDKYDYLKDYRLIWGHAIGIVEEDVIVNTDTGEHLAEGENCNNYNVPEGINYKKGKWLRFSGINNLNPKVIQEVILPDYIISLKDLCSSLLSIDVIEPINTSNIYNMSNAFHYKYNFGWFTINNTNKIIFDFSNVKDASSCFEHCKINNNSVDFINCSDFCNYARMFYFSYMTYIPNGLNKQNIGGEYMFCYAKLTGNLNITMKLYNNMFEYNDSLTEDDDFLTINGNFVCSNNIRRALSVNNKLIFNANVDFTNVEIADDVINIYNGTLDLTTLPEDCNYEGIVKGRNFNIIAPPFKLKLPLIKNDYDFTVNIINTPKYYTIFDSNINKKCAFCYFESNYHYPCNITINGTIETSFLFGGVSNDKSINLSGSLKLIDNCPINIDYDDFGTLCYRVKNYAPTLAFNIQNDEAIDYDDYSTLDLLKIRTYTKNINKENKTVLLTSKSFAHTIYTNANSKIYINANNGNYNINNDGEPNEIYIVNGNYRYAPIINAPNSNIYYRILLSNNITCNIDSAKKIKIDYNYYDNTGSCNSCGCNINILNNIDSIEYNGGINIRLRNNKKLTLESSYVYTKNDISYNIFLPFDIWQVDENNLIIDSCPFPNLIHKNGDNYLICTNNFYKDFDVNLLNKCIYRYHGINIDFINGIQLIDYLSRYIELSNSINTSNDIIINFNNINFDRRDNKLYCNGDYRKVTIKNFGGDIISYIYGEWDKQNTSDDNEEKRYINYIPENIEGGMINIRPGKSTYLNLLINIAFYNSDHYSDFNSTIIGYDNYEFNYETIIYSSTIFCPLIINIFNCQSLTHLDVSNAKFAYKLALNYCDNLDDDSINSIINAQYNDGTEVIISYIIYNKLTEEQKETIINKGCTLISFVYER